MKRHLDQPGTRGACLTDLIEELSSIIDQGGRNAAVYLLHPNREPYPLSQVVTRSFEGKLIELDGLFLEGKPVSAEWVARALVNKRKTYGECDVMIYHWGVTNDDPDSCLVSFLQYDLTSNEVLIASHASERAHAVVI